VIVRYEKSVDVSRDGEKFVMGAVPFARGERQNRLTNGIRIRVRD
jgi:hypothetical protein